MAVSAPPPGDVATLVATERRRLLELLATVDGRQWEAPTPCPQWNVLELCAHLVGVDMGLLSRHRDGYLGTPPPPGLTEEQFIDWLDDLQMAWVSAARRLSPRVVTDLLAWSGPQLVDTFTAQDPARVSAHVSWAGPDPVPVWLDQVRELSEYWIHRQQILQALGRPPDLRPDLAGPVLDGLRWAYPFRLGAVPAEVGDTVSITVSDPVSTVWHLVADGGGWEFQRDPGPRVVARLTVTTDQAWRLLSNNLAAGEAAGLTLSGDGRVVDVIRRTRAIIGTPD